MTRKLLPALLLLVLLQSSSFAAPSPPSKGQWAFPLEDTLTLYTKADGDSRSQEVRMPQKWISVPSAVRDSDNYLWYKVNVNGKSGWLPQNGIRLKMGGKSKSAANLYRNYVKARRRIMDRPGKWTVSEEDGLTEYSTDGAMFRVTEGRKGVEDVFFTTNSYEICREFFGIDLIDFSQPEVRSKLGTPTMRETPYESPEISILSFELDGRNMTLSILERREDGDTEGTVYRVELYAGRTGEPEY
ncbi:MAG: hypothetical protein IJG37_00080 [Synergistaceae bacterium]|nr:hypothetical protein [Synergistaceae bacterium]MBQ7169317.1 hypothetical protein [Synergistaceae bacterium]